MLDSDTQIWYELESSVKGANDWFATGIRADTRAFLQKTIQEHATLVGATFDLRLVRKTLTTTPLK